MSIADRKKVKRQFINEAMQELWEQLQHRLDTKGPGTFASKHEILGILDEEFMELEGAVKMHGDKSRKEVAKELLDIAVGAVFGVACIRAETIDW